MLLYEKICVKLLLDLTKETCGVTKGVNMEACLGIYLSDKIIKYAKLTREEKSRRVSLYSCGTKYVAGNKDEAIKEIIEQTGSAEDLKVLNISNYTRMQTEIFKQLGKSDMESVIALEVGDYATSKGLNEKALEYRYLFMDSVVSGDSYTADIAITDKANINKYLENENYSKLVGLYPQEYILNSMVQTNSNYLIANVDEKTQLISVVNGKIKQIETIDIGMQEILDTIASQEGSYSKACDLCKSINVLSDDSISPSIERIIEPTIQDLLNRIKFKMAETKINYETIYLNGSINLFINIDVLFEQFFGITTEQLRPRFINLDEIANMSEIIEAGDAVALAYQGLEQTNSEVNFIQTKNAKPILGNLFTKNSPIEKTPGEKRTASVLPNINKEKIEKALLFANLTAGAVCAGYVAFSGVYDAQMTKMAEDLSNRTNSLTLETTKIISDAKYVSDNANKYVNLNNYISETVSKIKEGKIGKYTTYNVANFMQRVAKYIPSNVELQTISSNDNKTVSIVARSTSYSELGYFISQLKLKGILENIKTSNVKNGNYITVTIGGDLP